MDYGVSEYNRVTQSLENRSLWSKQCPPEGGEHISAGPQGDWVSAQTQEQKSLPIQERFFQLALCRPSPQSKMNISGGAICP